MSGMPKPTRFRNTEEILDYLADLDSESSDSEEEESEDQSDPENDATEGIFCVRWKALHQVPLLSPGIFAVFEF